MSAGAKRKISITVDADLVQELEARGDNLSGRINAALRNEVGQQRRQQALEQLLEHLDAERGPLDSPEDEAEIQRLMRLLGGAPQ